MDANDRGRAPLSLGTIIITGSGRGIGAATARLAAKRGYAVCVNYRERAESAEDVVRSIVAAGGSAVAIKADSSDEREVKTLFSEAQRQLGPLAALVNNAGVPGRIGRVADLSLDNLRRVLEVNVTGTMLCAREAVRVLSTRFGGKGGAIVNVSSMASKTGSPGELVPYAAAKAAVETFTYGLGAEVAQEGIRVNCVSCGLIATDIHAEAGDASRLERYATRMPMARPGKPEEVAAAILFLLSEEASYVTGATLPVAGGR
jgi:NAD(P)-dependent dehydrogenase (short-subunit alcohol dehydrogenase family)